MLSLLLLHQLMMQGTQTFIAIVAMPNDFSLLKEDDDELMMMGQTYQCLNKMID